MAALSEMLEYSYIAFDRGFLFFLTKAQGSHCSGINLQDQWEAASTSEARSLQL